MSAISRFLFVLPLCILLTACGSPQAGAGAATSGSGKAAATGSGVEFYGVVDMGIGSERISR